MARAAGVRVNLPTLKRLGGPETARQIGAALFAAGDMVAVEEARLITEGSVSGAAHVPSAPGKPPNADTHMLDRSIATIQPKPMHVQVVTEAPYAVALQFGTSKMAARPYADVALNNKRDEAFDLIRRAIRKIIGGGKVVP